MKHRCIICLSHMAPKYQFMACHVCRGVRCTKANSEQKQLGNLIAESIVKRVFQDTRRTA